MQVNLIWNERLAMSLRLACPQLLVASDTLCEPLVPGHETGKIKSAGLIISRLDTGTSDGMTSRPFLVPG